MAAQSEPLEAGIRERNHRLACGWTAGMSADWMFVMGLTWMAKISSPPVSPQSCLSVAPMFADACLMMIMAFWPCLPSTSRSTWTLGGLRG